MNTSNAIFEYVKYALFNGVLSEELKSYSQSEEFLTEVFKVAKKHDVAHLVGYALNKCGYFSTSNIVNNLYGKEQFLAVYRYENMKHEIDRLTDLFEKNEVECILLKGSYLRKFYPEEWLRTSCDIDILVRNSQIQKAIGVMVDECGYELKDKNGHDYHLYSPNGVLVELHFTLIEEDTVLEAEKILENVWEYVKPIDDFKYIYTLNEDMFYYYHIIHMAKHLLCGGCGIKPIIDIAVIQNSFKFTEQKDSLLKDGGLDKVESVSRKLAEVWFSGRQGDEKTARLGEYILNGGVYGNTENRIAANKEKTGGTFLYALHRIFLPYKLMVIRYPSLEKRKWLYPLYQFRRWYDLLFKGRAAYSFNELKINQTISKEKLNNTNTMFDDLGLK